ncbi:MAG TPA: hypothetical protein VGX28_02730 [Frankiaceae bacterium]|jgi:hypothetical protein|nr:hypothetical protein [Frankiaceae bacterium]
MRTYAALAALALLAACGGDAEPKPDATPAPTQSTAALPPEAKAVRDATAKTLAACPCEVTVRVSAFAGKPYDVTLRGVYDPRTFSAELKEVDGGAETGIVFRIVDGRTYMDPAIGQWVELDFSGLPAKPVSPLHPVALADPRIVFAVASSVSTASVANGDFYDVAYDMATAVPATGPWADMVKRLAPGESVYDKVKVSNGSLTFAGFATTDSGKGDEIHVGLTVEATGRTAPGVAVPTVVRKVDVATEEIEG